MVTEDREDELQALATAQGWTFSIVDNDDLLTTLSFRFFTNGVAHNISDVIEGTLRDRGFVEFDYEWQSRAGGTLEVTMTLVESCAVVAIPALCPELMVSHETTAHWLEHPFHHEVFTSEREEFARRFRVTTTDPAFAAAILDPAVEQWFLDSPPEHDLCFEINGSWLMCFTHRRDAAEVPIVIEAAVAFAERIPTAAIDALPAPPAV
jgi:hypothetical protein